MFGYLVFRSPTTVAARNKKSTKHVAIYWNQGYV